MMPGGGSITEFPVGTGPIGGTSIPPEAPTTPKPFVAALTLTLVGLGIATVFTTASLIFPRPPLAQVELRHDYAVGRHAPQPHGIAQIWRAITPQEAPPATIANRPPWLEARSPDITQGAASVTAGQIRPPIRPLPWLDARSPDLAVGRAHVVAGAIRPAAAPLPYLFAANAARAEQYAHIQRSLVAPTAPPAELANRASWVAARAPDQEPGRAQLWRAVGPIEQPAFASAPPRFIAARIELPQQGWAVTQAAQARPAEEPARPNRPAWIDASAIAQQLQDARVTTARFAANLRAQIRWVWAAYTAYPHGDARVWAAQARQAARRAAWVLGTAQLIEHRYAVRFAGELREPPTVGPAIPVDRHRKIAIRYRAWAVTVQYEERLASVSDLVRDVTVEQVDRSARAKPRGAKEC
ncbi:MAG: hypothetical protein NZM12_01440 [Steroidobacteraceae bacterium]|nr:hypothetical protein [Steroidobacteraceae bacterium]MDW8260850.1 hypothetical protein [Gammaproteobacteria bacterium]